MRPGGAKEKGNEFQRTQARYLTSLFGRQFVSTPASGGHRWKNIKNTRGDITTDWLAWPYTVECKHDKKWDFDTFSRYSKANPLVAWWEQASNDALDTGKLPLLIFTKNRRPTYLGQLYSDDVVERLQRAFVSFLVLTIPSSKIPLAWRYIIITERDTGLDIIRYNLLGPTKGESDGKTS